MRLVVVVVVTIITVITVITVHDLHRPQLLRVHELRGRGGAKDDRVAVWGPAGDTRVLGAGACDFHRRASLGVHHVHLLALVLRDGERDVRAVGGEDGSACGAGRVREPAGDAPQGHVRGVQVILAHEHQEVPVQGGPTEVPARPRAVPRHLLL